ncbi:BolA domain-containing protein [Salpingoeca rosetta]|uniref:BolA domain-containing protein n=1 Tax=Salpingoeca rosetta (strain ATCC 50818 / BSB-021) TaxID=946362 RepID=F2U5K7_SALR5|nr:BolA domain-containing protein [Salpingoeca rosetta]EGD83223.1 BolA domain-containing protein [Salpingoeca rosetta]|eukprot:XP_004995587.1 BolA domain-containing protein [Salpingoeca rosetta]
MAITAESIRAKLQDALEAQHVEVEDTSGGCGQAFEAVIVSTQFQGLPLLKRHRLVNTALEDELKAIHAFSQKTYTPEQWTKIQEKAA